MSSGGDFCLGDGPSCLTYKDKICPKCENFTTIRVSHSNRNPNKLYYWCNTHGFADWCLPTNVNIEEKSEEKREMDHGIKFRLKKKPWKLTASYKGSSIPSLLFFIAILVAFIVIILKWNVI